MVQPAPPGAPRVNRGGSNDDSAHAGPTCWSQSALHVMTPEMTSTRRTQLTIAIARGYTPRSFLAT